ncbi:MAG: hypothetical protein ACYSWP_18265 [Planctomycetota bacterium]|jgi:hypothetical protein
MTDKENNAQIQKPKSPHLSLATILIIIAVVAIILPWLIRLQFHGSRKLDICKNNLHQMAVVIHNYREDNEGKYPTPEIWCDLLQKPYTNTPEVFLCPSAPGEGAKGKSHYAINPNCEPNSPGDMVLLFETKGGWNKQGGPELLTTENHKEKGCNILFKDWSVKYIRTEELETLKWK